MRARGELQLLGRREVRLQLDQQARHRQRNQPTHTARMLPCLIGRSTEYPDGDTAALVDEGRVPRDRDTRNRGLEPGGEGAEIPAGLAGALKAWHGNPGTPRGADAAVAFASLSRERSARRCCRATKFVKVATRVPRSSIAAKVLRRCRGRRSGSKSEGAMTVCVRRRTSVAKNSVSERAPVERGETATPLVELVETGRVSTSSTRASNRRAQSASGTTLRRIALGSVFRRAVTSSSRRPGTEPVQPLSSRWASSVSGSGISNVTPSSSAAGSK